jgi:hypothetical protein
VRDQAAAAFELIERDREIAVLESVVGGLAGLTGAAVLVEGQAVRASRGCWPSSRISCAAPTWS